MGLFGRDQAAPPSPATIPNAKPAPSRPSGGSKPAGNGTTLVAPAAQFEGSLTGSGDVRIEGRVSGTVAVDGHVIVNQTGVIEATLKARVVVVAGEVHGDVFADEKIELQPTANLVGNMTAPRILIQEGAKFEGQVYMETKKGQGKGEARPAPSAKPGSQSSSSQSQGSEGTATSSKEEAKETDSQKDTSQSTDVSSGSDSKGDTGSGGRSGAGTAKNQRKGGSR